MSLKQIRLELARTKDFPDGSSSHGYEFVAPLDSDGQLNFDEWNKYHQVCTVRRFWGADDDEHGLLVRTRGRRWMFSYEPGEEDDEPIFKFDRHNFVLGEYMSITEHDGIARPFRIVSIDASPITRS